MLGHTQRIGTLQKVYLLLSFHMLHPGISWLRCCVLHFVFTPSELFSAYQCKSLPLQTGAPAGQGRSSSSCRVGTDSSSEGSKTSLCHTPDRHRGQPATAQRTLSKEVGGEQVDVPRLMTGTFSVSEIPTGFLTFLNDFPVR